MGRPLYLERVDSSRPLSGRRAELAQVLSLLDAGEAVVTLTGVVGVGKSRLAHAVAEEWRARGGEVAWVGARHVRTDAELTDALATALGASSEGAWSALSDLGDALLVIDGLAGSSAVTALHAWTSRSDEPHVLVTSRERALAGGCVVELSPLAPADAAELFADFAARRGHPVTDADAPFVLEVVRLLEGLPLAIELAAARTNIMAPRALVERLRSGLDVLGGLGAALESALDATTAPERDALAQLSVFRGGFRVESAEAVVDLSAYAAPPPVHEVLAALRDKSFVSQRGDRLDVLGALRDRAAAAADPAVISAAEERHAIHFATLADRLTHADRASLLAERDNILAVAERLLARRPVTARRAEPALRAMAALGDALIDAGTASAFEALLEPTLVATQGSGAKPALEAAAVLTRGALRLRRGDVSAATRDLVQALGVAKAVRDPLLEARATLELGHALELRGDVDASLEHFERAAALFDASGSAVDYGRALEAAGTALAKRGRTAEALAVLERAVAACAGSPQDATSARLALARAKLDQGDAQSAAAILASVTNAPRRLAARVTALSGLIALDRGELAAGAASLASAASEWRAMGSVREALRTETVLALARREQGHDGEAYVLAKGALAGLRESDADGAAMACAHLAVLELEASRADHARTLLGSISKVHSAETADVVAAAQASLDPSWPAPAPSTAHGRVARRVWHAPSPSKRPPPPDDALLVAPHGAWFRAPRGERVSLERRRNLALLLAHLASAHATRPGVAVPTSALVTAGWPDEKIIATAGAHRVRVAIATLRKLGLKDAIVTTPEGYALAAGIAVLAVE